MNRLPGRRRRHGATDSAGSFDMLRRNFLTGSTFPEELAGVERRLQA